MRATHPRVEFEPFVLDVGAVQRVGLGCDQPAVAHHQVLEVDRHARFLDDGAQAAQQRDHLRMRAADFGVDVRRELFGRQRGDAHAANVGFAAQSGVARSKCGACSVAGSRGSGPAIAAVSSAASSTVCVSGPSESSVVDSGTTPARLIRP